MRGVKISKKNHIENENGPKQWKITREVKISKKKELLLCGYH
jgi:hypothetical protein